MIRIYRDMPIFRKIFWIFTTVITFMIIISASGIYYSYKSTGAIINKNDYVTIIGTILGIAYSIYITNLLNKSFVTPLKEIKKFAENLSTYDLTSTVKVDRKDEFGQTGDALNTAKKNVKELLEEIMSNSFNMNASAEEVSATVQEITVKIETIDRSTVEINGAAQEASATSEEITASVEEVNASMDILSSKAMEGNDNAAKIKEKANLVKLEAKKALEESSNIYEEK